MLALANKWIYLVIDVAMDYSFSSAVILAMLKPGYFAVNSENKCS